MALLALAASWSAAQGGTRWVEVTLSQRDYFGDLPLTDRDWLDAETAQYTEPEFPSPPLPQRGAAYKRQGIVSVGVTFTNTSTQHFKGTLTFHGMRYAMPTAAGDDPPAYLPKPVSGGPFAVDLPPNSGQSFMVAFARPSFVGLGHVEVKYDLPLQDQATGQWGENGTGGGYERWEKLFFVDATPVGLQSVPWADYLEYTCRWAFGAGGLESLRERMTRGMYSSHYSPAKKLKYNGFKAVDGLFYKRHERHGQSRTYRLGYLTHSLDNVDPASYVEGDCRDYAGGLAIALMQHGQDADCVWMEEDNFSDEVKFLCTPVCGSPYDPAPWPGSYTSPLFNFHVVVLSGGKTFDSSNAYRYATDGSVLGLSPVEWTEDPHWRNQVGSSWYGLSAVGTDPYLPRPSMGPTSLDHTWTQN